MSVERLNEYQLENPSQVHELCEKWGIVRLEIFGSRARGTARPDSDVDLLVTFKSDASLSLMDLVQIEWDLSDVLRCKVDLVERAAIEHSWNPFRKSEILGTAKLLYAA